MMNELVNELNVVMGGYERIARKTKWKLYLDRQPKIYNRVFGERKSKWC